LKIKILELRDEGTFIPLLAVDMNPEPAALISRWYLRRCGYACSGLPNIAITRLDANGAAFSNDPYFWKGRTWPIAHQHILQNWNELKDGDVIDVSYILGETQEVKLSERFSTPGGL